MYDPNKHTPLGINSIEGTITGRVYDHIEGFSTFQYKQTCSNSTCIENRVIKFSKYTLQQRFSVDNPSEMFDGFIDGKFFNSKLTFCS